MKQLLLSAILLIALLLPAATQAQTKIKLKQADRLSAIRVKDIPEDVIKGNVIFTHGNTTIYCDSAYFNKKANSLEAFGNVRMQIANDTVMGSRLKYNGNTGEAILHQVAGERRSGSE